jgi:large subunit ribosomal protein L14
VGEIIVASVQAAEPRKQVKKKDIVRCVIVRSRAPIRRRDGTVVRFDDNAVVLIDKKEPRGTRIFGPIPREIKERGYDAIASLAEELV